MKSIKLNGWQRLWVVFSSLLFIPAVLLTVSSLPGNKEVMDDLEIQLREKGALDLFEILSVENLLNGKSVKDSEKEFNSTPDKTKIVLDEANIQRLYNEVKTKKILGYLQVIGAGLTIWLALASSIYLLGWSVGWIVRGFRKQ